MAEGIAADLHVRFNCEHSEQRALFFFYQFTISKKFMIFIIKVVHVMWGSKLIINSCDCVVSQLSDLIFAKHFSR